MTLYTLRGFRRPRLHPNRGEALICSAAEVKYLEDSSFDPGDAPRTESQAQNCQTCEISSRVAVT